MKPATTRRRNPNTFPRPYREVREILEKRDDIKLTEPGVRWIEQAALRKMREAFAEFATE